MSRVLEEHQKRKLVRWWSGYVPTVRLGFGYVPPVMAMPEYRRRKTIRCMADIIEDICQGRAWNDRI